MEGRLGLWRMRGGNTFTPFLRNAGYCPVCASDVVFVSDDAWLRDHYRCTNCGSIPCARALMQVLETQFL
jgi:hypothetical protein